MEERQIDLFLTLFVRCVERFRYQKRSFRVDIMNNSHITVVICFALHESM